MAASSGIGQEHPREKKINVGVLEPKAKSFVVREDENEDKDEVIVFQPISVTDKHGDVNETLKLEDYACKRHFGPPPGFSPVPQKLSDESFSELAFEAGRLHLARWISVAIVNEGAGFDKSITHATQSTKALGLKNKRNCANHSNHISC